MTRQMCSLCLLCEDIGSSDVGWCIVKDTHVKITEVPCGAYTTKESEND